jgi:hypothetical protein
VSLRAQLTLAFALFAALPMAAALVPLAGALSQSLGAEYAARLDEAALATEGEVARLAGDAAAAARDLAGSAEVAALSRDRREGSLEPADAAARGPEWMAARGLDALAIADDGGLVLSSGHLPGRAGDVDQGLRALLASPAGAASARLLARAGPAGVEEGLFLAAWQPVPGDPALRAVAGVALDARFAERVAGLTGGEVVVRLAGGDDLARAGAGAGPAGWRGSWARRWRGPARWRSRRWGRRRRSSRWPSPRAGSRGRCAPPPSPSSPAWPRAWPPPRWWATWWHAG